MLKAKISSQEKLIQLHLMHYFATMADDVVQDDDLFLIKSSVGDPYHNAVTFLCDEIDESKLAHLLERTQAFFHKHQEKDFCIWDYSYNSVKDIMPKTYSFDPSFTGLFCDLDATAYQLSEQKDITYKLVATKQDLEDFFIPFKTAFQFDETVANNIKSYYQNYNNNHQLTHYVAYHHDQAIAAASLFIYDKVAGLYNLSVLPEYRNRGIAKNLQRIRLNDANKQHIKHALIQAVPTTEIMTKQLKFKEYTKILPMIYRG